MKLDLNNVNETKARLKDLITLAEKQTCDQINIDELKQILEEIGASSELMVKYEDIYDDAADALMLAGITAEECSCDPLRKHIPKDKEKLDPNA
ncbi:MAG: hypothetical protein ACTSRW_13060 [Candidatus Helarchaeota archaeon]